MIVPLLLVFGDSFNRLGVKLSKPGDDHSIEKLALVMFDTRTIKVLTKVFTILMHAITPKE